MDSIDADRSPNNTAGLMAFASVIAMIFSLGVLTLVLVRATSTYAIKIIARIPHAQFLGVRIKSTCGFLLHAGFNLGLLIHETTRRIGLLIHETTPRIAPLVISAIIAHHSSVHLAASAHQVVDSNVQELHVPTWHALAAYICPLYVHGLWLTLAHYIAIRTRLFVDHPHVPALTILSATFLVAANQSRAIHGGSDAQHIEIFNTAVLQHRNLTGFFVAMSILAQHLLTQESAHSGIVHTNVKIPQA